MHDDMTDEATVDADGSSDSPPQFVLALSAVAIPLQDRGRRAAMAADCLTP